MPSELVPSELLTLTGVLLDELRASIRGNVYPRGNPNFTEYTAIWNGNVLSPAQAVACPLDAEDVSKIIIFCAKHSLSLSIKAGGYGTAGLAVGGDIVIDMSRLTDIEIEIPKEDGSYTSLHDMPQPNSKGKQAVKSATTSATPNPGKRRREEDVQLRVPDSASPSVAAFLRDGSMGTPGPSVRRRVSGTTYVAGSSSYNPVDLVDGEHANGSTIQSAHEPQADGQPEDSTGGVQTTHIITINRPLPQPDDSNSAGNAPLNADPFGYLDRPGPIDHTSNMHSSFSSMSGRTMYSSWGPGSSTFVANPRLPSTNRSMPSQSTPIHKMAYVTFGAGMRQKEIDMYTANHPLPGRAITGDDDLIPYHVPSAAHPTGSSIMLLGGFGFLSRIHGLSVDNVVEVEMVLADGRIVHLQNSDTHLELWWAIRGAGPAFGVATRYKAKAFPVPAVFAGNLLYRFNKATAASLIKHFRDCVKGAPRELYANVFLTAGPAGKDSLIVIQMCYVGPKEKGQEYLSAISSWDGEKSLLNEVNEKSFLHQQDSVAQVLRGKGKSTLITSLPDEIIHKTVLEFSETPVGCTWLFELAGGAISDFDDSCIPKSNREAAFTVAALHQWDMGLDDYRCISTAESWIRDTLKSVSTGGVFPSFLGRHEAPKRVTGCFGENWDRLCKLKQQYDPANVFRNSLWPLDQKGEKVADPTIREPPPEPSAGTSFDILVQIQAEREAKERAATADSSSGS
uniref:FAD-binding PCMH-type domain-containing protein n=1 Tax=Moniliophthora roreri TaxID=221103 RepID=A0A0W0FTG5_MONRR